VIYSDFIYRNRVIPRLVLLAYASALALTLHWYMSFPLEYTSECNAEVVQVLIVQGSPPDKAVELACSKKEVIGRPHGYTALLGAMFAAAPFIFGIYVNGRIENANKDYNSTAVSVSDIGSRGKLP
jgi:hypothetical protein